MKKAQADVLFETSWEVCNKVGGIYTVVKSKVELMKDNYRNYFMVGPFFSEKAKIETQQIVPPERLKKVFDKLEKEGIVCYFGKWLVKGEPNVILINFQKIQNQKNDIKKWLWEQYGIDTLNSHWDFEEPMIWSYAVGKLLQYVSEEYHNEKIVGHFHEWLAGIALLHLKSCKSNVKTVFTTHATMLGRTLAGSGVNLYLSLDKINPEKEAFSHGVQDKFLTEKICAKNCEVFTTVSEITSMEAEKILGRKADVLLLNGLDIQKFPNFEECSIKHKECRDVIREFLSYFFFPYYTFDLDQTIIFFIVGRYEFKNKGLDIFIQALGRLNDRLKKEGSKKTVATFFWIPNGVNGIKTELLESEERYEQIKEFTNRNLNEIKTKLIRNIMIDKEFTKESVFNHDFLIEAKKHMLRFNKEGSPNLCTHYLFNEHDDSIVRAFNDNGLLNRKEDLVKVIDYPVYLDGNDNLLGLKYYDALQGCHLGVFPSYYEPWGYTPLESAALGVPAITTDLAGYGRFIKAIKKGKGQEKNGGIFILDRLNQKYENIVQNFTDILYDYTQLYRKDRVEQKIIAKELAEYADWRILIENYVEAHNLALKK
jgi:glycogen synthase